MMDFIILPLAIGAAALATIALIMVFMLKQTSQQEAAPHPTPAANGGGRAANGDRRPAMQANQQSGTPRNATSTNPTAARQAIIPTSTRRYSSLSTRIRMQRTRRPAQTASSSPTVSGLHPSARSATP